MGMCQFFHTKSAELKELENKEDFQLSVIYKREKNNCITKSPTSKLKSYLESASENSS
jgi:hypothetical protein